MPLKLVLIAFEPVLHDLLAERLCELFHIVGAPRGPDEALKLVRTIAADVLLVDADLPNGEAGDLVAKLSLVGQLPIIALSADAAPGGTGRAALLLAGADAVLAKPAGPLPLSLDGRLGDLLESALREAAAA